MKNTYFGYGKHFRAVVNVTAEDIENGLPGQCAACPIKIAIDRLFPELAAEVYGGGGQGAALYKPGDRGWDRIIVGQLPQYAQDFVDRFDTPHLQHIAKPFCFVMEFCWL